MREYTFSPFNKDISEIEPDDLLTLVNVEEGWYVDYKQEGYKDSSDFAKHMSSFANQQGGFLFVGIKEDSVTTRASEFTGIEKDRLAITLEKIRSAATTNVTPEIHYETKIIDGPAELLGLNDDRCIIIIGIPEGVNTPYIHSCGKIYQRFSDSSKPIDVKEIRDRFSLDLLHKKRQKINIFINRFIKRKLHVPEHFTNIPYIEINIFPDLTMPRGSDIIEFDQFLEYVNLANKLEPAIRLNHIYPLEFGYCARDADSDNFSQLRPTIYITGDGCTKLLIPLQMHGTTKELFDFHAQKYPRLLKHIRFFTETIIENKYHKIPIIDYSFALVIIRCMYFITGNLNKEVMKQEKIYYSIELNNIANSIPFFPVNGANDNNLNNHLPLYLFNNIKIPLYPNIDSIRQFEIKECDNISSIGFASLIMYHIMSFCGVYKKIEDVGNITDALLNFYPEEN